MPPVLWSTRSTAAEARTDELPAPPGLAVFVTEPFYAPLSTRMAKSEIGDDLAFHEREEVRPGVGIPHEIFHEPRSQVWTMPSRAYTCRRLMPCKKVTSATHCASRM